MISSFAQLAVPRFDVQGHRGARGLMPENSIPAFLLALDSGVTTLEMDLAVTKDKQIVVTHEPWMSAAYCLDPQGKEIKARDEKKFNIYKMNYAEVATWDCGSKVNARFAEQKKMKTVKPLLSDVIVAVENHIKNTTKYEADYNIEIKSSPEDDNRFSPTPEVFSDLAYQLIDQYLPWNRVVIQSFDFRVLKYWHQKYPHVRLAALVENLKSIDENLRDLGFVPDIYSPEYKLLDKNEVDALHRKTIARAKENKPAKLRVVPWTVNDEKEMISLKEMGVDGFITDYPDRARKLKFTREANK
ncbi:MAG: glycerophosphodiester phosphodiesterase [Bacteroidetes bacterium]|nr:glycerophosphodiester phosphodiesterase [Bacteroidota bacterium]MBS1540743.1 glycerophosphodiester phosphodiesterase [Bacteroidota bacterium]